MIPSFSFYANEEIKEANPESFKSQILKVSWDRKQSFLYVWERLQSIHALECMNQYFFFTVNKSFIYSLQVGDII